MKTREPSTVDLRDSVERRVASERESDQGIEVNGVFEGGGAKGLVYIGALKACEKAGLRFGAVAGSSAGAITAALVACRYTAAEVEKMMPAAMRCLGGRNLALISVQRRSLLANKRLRTWLREAVAAKVGTGTADGDPTFADLRLKTNVSLYVITMDLASRQPFIFSPDLTPSASVADAVLASSAIPVVFPAQRVSIDGAVRRLADGGVWANYPSFVFLDEDFRACHDLDDGAEGRRTVGFLLGDEATEPLARSTADIRRAHGQVLSSDRGSAERELKVFGGLVTSPLTRAAAVAMPVLMVLLSVRWFTHEVDEQMPLIGRLPDGVEDFALLLSVLLFVALIGFSVILGFLVLRLGRALTDEGVVGVTAAMGVGPGVPYWVGAENPHPDKRRSHVAIRLPVPSGLKTLTDRPSAALLAEALTRAEATTASELAKDFDSPGTHVTQPAQEPSAADTAPSSSRRFVYPLLSTLAKWVGFLVGLTLAFSMATGIVEGRIAALEGVGLALVGTVMLIFHGADRSRRARASDSWLHRQSSALLIITALGCASLGVLLGAVLVFDASVSRELSIRERLGAESFEATVQSVQSSAGFTDDEWFVEVLFVADPPLRAYVEEATELPFVENDGDEVRPCAVAIVNGQVCFGIRTDHAFEAGDSTAMRYDRSRGVLYLQEDRWTFAGLGSLYPVLALSLIVLAYKPLKAWREKRQQPTDRPPIPLSTPAPPQPPPPPSPAAVEAQAAASQLAQVEQ